MTIAPSGEQFEITSGHQRATIVEVDTLEPPQRRRRGLGTEPMNCPPNAFQRGDGLVRLEPGQSLTTTWGVRVV